MCPAVPITTVGPMPAALALVKAALAASAIATSARKGGADRLREDRIVVCLDRAEVEHDLVVDDAPDHAGTARSQRPEQLVDTRPVEGDAPRRKGLAGERASADGRYGRFGANAVVGEPIDHRAGASLQLVGRRRNLAPDG